MLALKIIATIFNIAFALIVLFFTSKLSWKRKEDRVSIIGFSTMMLLYAADIALIWL